MKKAIFLATLVFFIANLATAQSIIKFHAGADYTVPMGDLGDLYQSGAGGHIGLSYKLADSWDIGAHVGYKVWNADNDYFSKKLSELSGENANIEVDMPYSVIPIMLDGFYYISRDKFQPFLTLSFGLHLAKIDANSVKLNGVEYSFRKSESKTVTAYKIGAGFNYLFSEKIGLNFAATLDGNGLEISQSESSSDGSSTTTNSSSSTTSFINIALGLMYSL